jgi:hypothetical protein
MYYVPIHASRAQQQRAGHERRAFLIALPSLPKSLYSADRNAKPFAAASSLCRFHSDCFFDRRPTDCELGKTRCWVGSGYLAAASISSDTHPQTHGLQALK